jgi:hypothetical protein
MTILPNEDSLSRGTLIGVLPKRCPREYHYILALAGNLLVGTAFDLLR